MRLGKLEHKHDDRTLMLANFMLPEVHVPAVFDFDKGKAKIPLKMWGNDNWGDCVIAGQANQLLRLERIEQRRTIPLGDQDAIDRYKALTGAQAPGDAKDTGLVVLDALRNWHHSGWMTSGIDRSGSRRNYTIDAYGELEPNDPVQLRMGIYLLHGVHFGFSLPAAAKVMTRNGVWDYNGETTPDYEPGSWGGHLVYSKAYVKQGCKVLTWGREVLVTDNFIKKYADEAWSVVDSLDAWKSKQTIDVPALTKQLQQITSKINL
jgi:hypothetical protein